MPGLIAALSEIVGRPMVDKTGDADAPEPSIFIALREQLGPGLEPANRTLNVLVVDHV